MHSCWNPGATIVSGCVAERVKSPTYAFFAFCMTSFQLKQATRHELRGELVPEYHETTVRAVRDALI